MFLDKLFVIHPQGQNFESHQVVMLRIVDSPTHQPITLPFFQNEGFPALHTIDVAVIWIPLFGSHDVWAAKVCSLSQQCSPAHKSLSSELYFSISMVKI